MVNKPQRPGFRQSPGPGVHSYRGDPNCQAAHDYLRDCLAHVTAGSFLTGLTSLDTRRQGNLGEFICWCIGNDGAYHAYFAFAANAFEPLSNISTDGIDIVWISFGDDPAHDCAVLQEVKTTSQANLAYARTVVSDYQKLFGVDPALTLHTRFQSIKNDLEFGHRRLDLSSRVDALAGLSARACPQVTLLPCAVHDLASDDPASTLLAVRTSIAAFGWPERAIFPWSVAMDGLSHRLLRLAMGQN